MDETLESLEKEYCPPLDPALFSAIVSDFDLDDASSRTAARQVLDSIKASALEQDSSVFDPSGNSSHFANGEEHGSSDQGSASDAYGLKSPSTDLSSLSNGVLGMTINDGGSRPDSAICDDHMYGYEQLDAATKMLLLKEMFPNSSDYTVSYTLKKCDGNWTRALEELLNHTFFNDGSLGHHEDRIATKGIEAFLEDTAPHTRRGRKKKDRSKRRTLDIEDSPRSSSLPSAPPDSSWEKGRKDIDFIAGRTELSRSLISSVHHLNGASLPATIIALVEGTLNSQDRRTSAIANDPSVQLHAIELRRDFPSIALTHATGLICLTQPSTANAHELAKALVSSSNSTSFRGLDILPRYAPLNISSEPDGSPPASSRRGASVSENDVSISSGASYAARYALASSHNDAAQRSFSSASAAYRRGRSDHLMSAAAGYYSQVGRDHAAARAEATAGAADALVESQSSAGCVDLHGVAVKDAVRIARARTERWWRGGKGGRTMGLDGRMRNDDDGVVGALAIVTGLGRHSEGGRGKLGPAVGKMLLSEGWNVVFGEGVLSVTGRKKRL